MSKQKFNDLRKRAEAMLGSDNTPFSGDSHELRAALHELHTHQIELELQNEELRSVQEELIETRDQYVDLYDFAPVGYLTLTDKNLIVEANLTVAALLGVEKISLYNQPFSRYVFHEDQDIFYKHFRELIDSPHRRSCELRMLRPDGDRFWAKLECVSRTKTDKSALRIRIAINDITAAKHLETEIIKAKKLEATALLAGGIAHDFNNLLTIIMGNIEMAQEDMLIYSTLIGRPVADKLLHARDACLAAADLTKKFLTFSSGGEPLKIPTSVKTFMTNAVSLALAGSNVNCEYSFPDNLRLVEVDAGQMAQAIGNVITNARDAMPQGGVIRIRAENSDSVPWRYRELLHGDQEKYVKISIEDQGVGIAGDILTQVFDPYFSSKERGREKGLGLGLTVVHSIMTKHGGAIDIASQQNIGTTVSLYLPASDKRIDSPASIPGKAHVLNKKILVMDDEELIRLINIDMLERMGYEVETARNGEEAVQIYADAHRAGMPFGAVILDLTIKGGMGGEETIKRLKELDPDIRAIVASGYANDPVMSNFREYGFLGALHKPYQLRDIEKSLKVLFDEAKER
ncbi:MAG: hypothetical protein BM485_07500 [Desulfobulbaceae bacterium DB1]|nr:MAG: hypothetical protein BM485_07500 [Desulfobulbaceae bacterium DB1]